MEEKETTKSNWGRRPSSHALARLALVCVMSCGWLEMMVEYSCSAERSGESKGNR